jgi:aspartate/methionine/tyrosine aminotransferase
MDIPRMNTPRLNAGSTYMEWAKLHSSAKHNLATSGVAGLPLAELGVTIEQLEVNSSDNNYGYPPLLETIAQRYRVPRESVVSAIGTSLANYLALAAATEPGDEILVEQPTYDPLLSIARYLGLEIKRFQRPSEQNFAIDLADLERKITPRMRVIVLSNLHNPSGALVPASTLREISALATKKSRAYILVDEVYREMLFEAEPQTAFHIDPERFLITNSLTKAYGLSGLRCGWILAPREMAARIWRLHDIHSGTYSYPSEVLSSVAFRKLPAISTRAKSMLNENRALLRKFLESRNELDYFWPEYGTIVFPSLKSGKVDALCDLLRNDFGTTVVPGRFFECPDRLRIGVGGETESVRQSLRQLALGLDRWNRRDHE